MWTGDLGYIFLISEKYNLIAVTHTKKDKAMYDFWFKTNWGFIAEDLFGDLKDVRVVY